MKENGWQKCAAIIICVGGAGAAVWLGVKYLLPLVLPFAIAWAAALAVRRPTRWLSQKSGLSHTVCTVVTVTALLGLVTALGAWGVRRLVIELEELIRELRQYSAGSGKGAFGGLEELVGRLPFVGELIDGAGSEQLREGALTAVTEFASSALEGLAQLLPSAVLGAISKLPSLLIFLPVALISCYYFAIDSEKIHAALSASLPSGIVDGWRGIRRRASGVLAKYARAYFILFLINFAVLGIGFAVISVDCVLLMALTCAAVDLLPILGTGTVLLPWAVWCMLCGDSSRGIGLVVIYLAVTVIHRIAEPYVIGESLGVHPLLTLGAIYVGYRLFGVWGMILLPPTVAVVGGFLGRRKDQCIT